MRPPTSCGSWGYERLDKAGKGALAAFHAARRVPLDLDHLAGPLELVAQSGVVPLQAGSFWSRGSVGGQPRRCWNIEVWLML